MPDRVVLCEGKKDVRFLTELYTHATSLSDYDIFYNKEADLTETQRLRQHLMGNQFSILFKSEGGKSELTKIAPGVIIDMRNEDVEVTILVGLDVSPLDDFVSSLNSRLHDFHRNNVKIQTTSKSFEDKLLYASCGVYTKGTKSGMFKIMAFYDDQEEETGIAEGDSSAVQIDKIQSYIDENPSVAQDIVEFIRS